MHLVKFYDSWCIIVLLEKTFYDPFINNKEDSKILSEMLKFGNFEASLNFVLCLASLFLHVLRG